MHKVAKSLSKPRKSEILLINLEMCTDFLRFQMEFGDRVSQDNQSSDKIVKILERFYPRKLMEPMTGEQRR